MDYKITDESITKAKLVFESVFNKHGSAIAAFTAAVDVLCMPKKELPQWRLSNVNDYKYHKGEYILTRFPNSGFWALDIGDKRITTTPTAGVDYEKAYLWANDEIIRYEQTKLSLLGWIRLLPLGRVELVDSRQPFEVDQESLAAMVADFEARGVDLVIDYEHQSLKGERAPAAGWIKHLEDFEDGLWARVEWTPQAQEYLSRRGYRYFSPVLRLDPETRKPTALLHVGLTNTPAIKRLPPLRPRPSKSEKPFGPGTRLQTTTGAELRIVANQGSYAAVNLDVNYVPTRFNWQSLVELKKVLEEANATIIEDD